VPAKKPISAFLCEKRDAGINKIKTNTRILPEEPGQEIKLS
jgi:hypothetical protein